MLGATYETWVKTFLGFSLALGTIGSTTLSSFFDLDAQGNIIYTDRKSWDWAPVSENPSASQITSILALENLISPYFVGKRPYRWLGFYFSEAERNHYRYMQNINTAVAGLVSLDCPIPSSIPPGAGPMIRDVLTWNYQLFPFFGALEAASNHNTVSDGVYLSVKNPAGYINDYQLHDYVEAGMTEPNSILHGLTGLVVPVPEPYDIDQDLLELNDLPTTGLTDQAESDIAHIVSDGQIPVIAIGTNQHWFRQNDPKHTDLVDFTAAMLQHATPTGPDIYVTGHTMVAQGVMAGFFTNANNSSVTVPLVIQPMFGIPRTNPTGAALSYLDPNINANVYNDPPPAIQNNGDLKVHIRKGGLFSPNAQCLKVSVIYSHLDAAGGLIIENYLLDEVNYNADNELVFDVPAFDYFVVVNIVKCE